MTAKIIDGKMYAAELRGKVADAVHRLARDRGRCNGVQWGGEGPWNHGPGKPGGRRLCYFDDDGAVIVWTHEKLGQEDHRNVLGIAEVAGTDHAGLFDWWRFWVHRIGKLS